jgi:hypothetical protein
MTSQLHGSFSQRKQLRNTIIPYAPRQLLHESGWSRNGAGKQYSHKFGYGLMDAAQMVDLVTSRVSDNKIMFLTALGSMSEFL